MSRNQCLLRYGQVHFWMDISGDHLLGLSVLPNTETDAVNHWFLVIDLPVLSEYVPLLQRQCMAFIHEGAPPHFLNTVRQHLNQALGEQRIGHGGPKDLCIFSDNQWFRGTTAMSRELPLRIFEWNQEILTECAPLCNDELNVVLKCIRTT
jgi:hypothetical protein